MVVNWSSAYITIATCCKWLLTYVKHKGGILWVRTKHTIFGSFFHHKTTLFLLHEVIYNARIWETPFPNAMAGCALKLCPLSFLQVYILLYKLALLWIRLVSYAKYVLFIFCLSRVNCQDTFDCLKRLRTEVEVRGKQATKAVFSESVLCIQSFLCFCSFFL